MSTHLVQEFPLIRGHGTAVDEFSAETLVLQMKESGTIILRDFARDQESFIALTKRLAPGIERGVAPGQSGLDFHGEAYYTPWPPDVLWFYCVCPAKIDGQTLLCDGIKLVSLMAPESKAFFVDNALVYEMAWAHAVWASYFNTENKETIIDHLKKWPSVMATFSGNIMYTRYTTWAIRQTKWGGVPAFVNSLLHALDSTRRAETGEYGLRTQIPSTILSELRDLTAKLAFWIEWKPGDIVMIDNTRVMHARRPFSGRREIIAVNGNALF